MELVRVRQNMKRMKHLKTYQIFESEKGLTSEQEAFLNKCTQGQWKLDPSTGLVDIDGDFSCSFMGLETLKGIRFGVIGGNFYCSTNRLETLEGAPQKVGGDFYCTSNRLETLEGAPQEVGGDFDCNAFSLDAGKWNPAGWMEILRAGSPDAQKLIMPLLTPEALNQGIQKNPEGMIMKLKSIWNDPEFRETRERLVFPRGYEVEMDLLGDLSDVGL